MRSGVGVLVAVATTSTTTGVQTGAGVQVGAGEGVFVGSGVQVGPGVQVGDVLAAWAQANETTNPANTVAPIVTKPFMAYCERITNEPLVRRQCL